MHYSELLDKLKGDIAAAMDGLVEPGSACALVDFPNHANVGDSAIWLGEVHYLRDKGVRVVYACDHANFNLEQMRRKLSPGDTILLHGGGNFGDVWPKYQQFREDMVRQFGDYRIVQLAQTVRYGDRQALERSRAVFAAHPDFSILVRDHESLEFVRAEFDMPCRLCPDFAFWLGQRRRPAAADCEVLWMSRTDHEAGGQPLPRWGDGVEGPVDWLEDGWSWLRGGHIALSRVKRYAGARVPGLLTAQARLFAPLAAERVLRGERLLARGKAVVTNRLHGHIMCLLLGISHVLLDNNYGKVANYYRAWTSKCDLVELAETPQEALDRAWAAVKED